MSIRKVFEKVLDSNADAAKIMTARVAGKAAKEALFANPSALQSVLSAGAVINIAALADPESAHGEALHYLGLGMSLDAADDLLLVCDENGVFQMKGTAADSDTAEMQAVISKTFSAAPFLKMLGVTSGDTKDKTDSKKVRFSTQSKPEGVKAAAPTANAVPNATIITKPDTIEAAVAEAIPTSAVVGPEVATTIVLPEAKVETKPEVLRCAYPNCGDILKKDDEKKPWHAPKDPSSQAVLTDEMKALEGSYLCKMHRSQLDQRISKAKHTIIKNEEKAKKLAGVQEELANVEAEVRESEKALSASEKTAAKITDPILKEGIDKTLTEKRNSIQNLRRKSISLQNQCKMIEASLAMHTKK